MYCIVRGHSESVHARWEKPPLSASLEPELQCLPISPAVVTLTGRGTEANSYV